VDIPECRWAWRRLRQYRFSEFLKFDPGDPHWHDRDRFMISNGDGSMLLDALLFLTGYRDMSIEELKRFRKIDSKTSGGKVHQP
jgi:transketolase